MLLLYMCMYTHIKTFFFVPSEYSSFPKFPAILALPSKAKIHLPVLRLDTSVSETRVLRYVATVVPSGFG